MELTYANKYEAQAAGLVTLSDVAERLHVSRQLVHRWATDARTASSFPAPKARYRRGKSFGRLYDMGEVRKWRSERVDKSPGT